MVALPVAGSSFFLAVRVRMNGAVAEQFHQSGDRAGYFSITGAVSPDLSIIGQPQFGSHAAVGQFDLALYRFKFFGRHLLVITNRKSCQTPHARVLWWDIPLSFCVRSEI